MSAEEKTEDTGPAATLVTQAVLTGLNEEKIVASDVGATITGISEEHVERFVYELCWAVARGALEPAKFAVALRAAGLAIENGGIEGSVADTLWLVWAQVEDEAIPGAKSRLAGLVHQLITKDALLSKARVKDTMDAEFLAELGFVASVQAQKSKEIKLNTKMNYTQSKFNLLREESEGFAKLVTLLNQFGEAAITDASYEATATEMKSLIGDFNLDPSRVLDILLDAFQQQPRNVIFARFMHHFSPRVVAQNLGFKFQRAHKEGKGTSRHLCCVAAALIKNGLVSLEDLMGHLEPSDADLATLQATSVAQLKELVAKIGVTSLAAKSSEEKTLKDMGISSDKMALDVHKLLAAAMAGLSSSSQHLALLEGCLLVGHWEGSKRLAGHLQARGVAPAHHEPVARALCKLVSRQTAPLVAALYPRGADGPSVLDEQTLERERRGVSGKPAQEPTTRPATFSDELEDMLQLLGWHVCLNRQLWVGLCRLTRHKLRFCLHSLASSASGGPATGLRAMLDTAESYFLYTLLPASTLAPLCPMLAHEIWAVLSLYSYPARFRFYADWRAITERTPLLLGASKLAANETRKVLRRLHVAGDQQSRKEGVRPFARIVGKAALVGPFSVPSALVAQVESYANLAEPVLDAMRNFTPLGFDILTFLLVDKLASNKREKLKADGVNTADWFKALSVLTAGACKKFPGSMGIHVICQYVVNQLKDYSGFDLLVLSDLIKAMSGIEAISDMSDRQVECCGGGAILRTEVVYFALQKNTKHLNRSMQALVGALLQGGDAQRLLLPLLVLICQQRDATEVMSEAKDIKFISQQLDSCQQAFIQLLEFMRTALSPAQYAAQLPTTAELSGSFGLDAATALTIHRPLLARVQPPPVASVEDGEIGDAAAAAAAGNASAPTAPVATAAAVADGPRPNGVAQMNVDGTTEDGDASAQAAWQARVADVRALYPAALWDTLSPDLVLAFWSLSLPDISFPAAWYEAEEKQMVVGIKAKQAAIREARIAEEVARHQTELNRRNGYDETVFSANTLDIGATEKEISRLQDAVKKLPGESKRQAAHAAATDRGLRRLRDLLSQHTVLSARSSREMLQNCIIPRLLTSPEDALFCARFIHRMHDLDMPGFPTCLVINEAFALLMPYLFIATDSEAVNIGIFLNAVMQLYNRWLADERLYTAECIGKHGFREKFSEPKPVSFATFRDITVNWAARLQRACLLSLRSGDYVRLKNTLHVLSRLIKVFPKTEAHGLQLRNAAADIVKAGKAGTETREDILNRATNYHAMISAELKKKSRFSRPAPAEKPAAVDGKAGAKAAAAPKAAATPNSTRSTPEPGQIKAEEGGRRATADAAPGKEQRPSAAAAAAVKKAPTQANGTAPPPSAKTEARDVAALPAADRSKAREAKAEAAAVGAGAKRGREDPEKAAEADKAAATKKSKAEGAPRAGSPARALAAPPGLKARSAKSSQLSPTAAEFKPKDAAAAAATAAPKTEAVKDDPNKSSKRARVAEPLKATKSSDADAGGTRGGERSQRVLDRISERVSERGSRRDAPSQPAAETRELREGSSRHSTGKRNEAQLAPEKSVGGSKRKREAEPAVEASRGRRDSDRAKRDASKTTATPRPDAKPAAEEDKAAAQEKAREEALKAFKQSQQAAGDRPAAARRATATDPPEAELTRKKSQPRAAEEPGQSRREDKDEAAKRKASTHDRSMFNRAILGLGSKRSDKAAEAELDAPPGLSRPVKRAKADSAPEEAEAPPADTGDAKVRKREKRDRKEKKAKKEKKEKKK